MDADTAKKLIEKNLSYDEVKRLAVKLVRHASPQTALLEAEPQVLALIRDIVKPELEQAGLRPSSMAWEISSCTSKEGREMTVSCLWVTR